MKGRLILALVVAVGASLMIVHYRGRSTQPDFVLEGKQFGRAPQIFLKQCSACHGPEGFGDGKAAYLLFPRPRDFSQGKFLLVSTDNRVPTDEDLFRTISRGMPGSAMPPWAHIAEQERRDLVKYVRALAHRGKVKRLTAEEKMPQKKAEETASYVLEVGKPLELPAEVAASDHTIQHGKAVYKDYCAKCHGAEGRGDGSQKMEDDLGFRAYPRDFTKGIFKGGIDPPDLARRILGGMPGSAMPTSELKRPDDLWPVVQYVRSLVQPGAQERVAQQRQAIRARRAAQSLTNDPLAPLWDQIDPTYIALMPLWWRNERVEGVNVRAAYDDRNVAVELIWTDVTENQEQAQVKDFGDAAALQLFAGADPPFFGMGDAAGVVNIWMWKAVWEKDLVSSNHPPEEARATYAGWGAGNLISNPHRPGPVENLNAKGFGTLHSQGIGGQSVRGKGVWKDGTWRVVFLRSLAPASRGDVRFQAGHSTRIAFAVWDGNQGDRNGQKSVTIWHDLTLVP